MAGNLEPPGDAVTGGGDPVSTMKTLKQIPPTWSQVLPCPTQINCPRFEVLSRVVINFIQEWGVLDRNTGITWEKVPTSTVHFGVPGIGVNPSFVDARRYCLLRTTVGQMGWRLPSIHELLSLVDPSNPNGNPDLPPGHPFLNVGNAYWSSTRYRQAVNGSIANDLWAITFNTVNAFRHNNSDTLRAWCVRGGGPLSEY